MDEESQDAVFDSDDGKGPFFDAVTVEETSEAYEEDVLSEGVVPEDETAAVDKNATVNVTVDAGENVDAADNLPSVYDVPSSHFIYQNDLDKMKVVDLKEILKARGLSIAGKKADLKLRLQQAVSAGVQILSEEVTQQPRNQMEGLQPAAHWEDLKQMYEALDSPDDDE